MVANKTAVAEPEVHTYRLPQTVIPERYEIRLEPDLKTFKFEGEEKIAVEVKQPVKQILLNALELAVHEARIERDGTKYDAKIELNDQDQRLILTFSQEIPAGKWQLYIKFTGTLNDKLHGFYRSTYKDAAGNQKVLATTQLEATDARRAFPCWDEPSFKAVFKTTLVVDDGLTAISNAGVESEKKVNGQKEVTFKDTIKMSTYLVAFVVGEFEATPPVMAGKTPMRIFAPPGKLNLASFAQGIGVHALTYFEKFYGVPYPGDKLDMVAIPDFAFGAMENLGCITYRETALLVDEKTASHAEQERVADVVAHEIAHMWFGDLTTMSWWNGIWLNEAFATFAEMLAVDAWKPEWKRWDSFGVSRAAAFAVDGLKSTRPIEFPVRRPEECEAMFDVLTYQKGASVLRMLEQYLTAETFRKGISAYLGKHKFANTETSDLWDALEASSKEPIGEIMDSWIFHEGYPMVTAELDSDGKTLILSQQRFFYLQDADKRDQLFQVPVMLRVSANGKDVEHRKVLLKDKTMKVDLGYKPAYVVLNDGGSGFYRVRYSPELFKSLIAKPFEIYSAIERFNMVNDTWAMVVAGHVQLTEYLKMVAMLKDESDKNVWTTIIGSLNYLEREIDDSETAKFQKFVKELLSPLAGRLSWTPKGNEDTGTRQLRGMVYSALGALAMDADTQKKAAELYASYKRDPSSVDADVAPALVQILAASGDKARYDEFLNEYKNAKTPQDEDRYMYALAWFNDKALLKKTLSLTLSSDVRTQNAPYLLKSVMMNTSGREMAWDFTKSNWKDITTKFPDNSISRMVEGVIALARPEWEKDVVRFFQDNPMTHGQKLIDQHIERLHVAVVFKEREGESFKICFS
jgi:puromycin-sensitive aminopeptidase